MTYTLKRFLNYLRVMYIGKEFGKNLNDSISHVQITGLGHLGQRYTDRIISIYVVWLRQVRKAISQALSQE
jgi:hypothetical protein